MKFVTIILPIFATLAQSVPVETEEFTSSADIGETFSASTATPEDVAKIIKEFRNLVDAFDAEYIDPTVFYCWKPLTENFISHVFSVPSLKSEVNHFRQLVQQYSLNDEDFFFIHLMLSVPSEAETFLKLTAEDMTKIKNDYDNLRNAIVAADIDPANL